MGWVGLEGTLRTISFPTPLPWAGPSSTRSKFEYWKRWKKDAETKETLLLISLRINFAGSWSSWRKASWRKKEQVNNKKKDYNTRQSFKKRDHPPPLAHQWPQGRFRDGPDTLVEGCPPSALRTIASVTIWSINSLLSNKTPRINYREE